MDKKPKIKAIIFDIEGVLTTENGEIQREIFAKELNIDKSKFSQSALKYLDMSHRGQLAALDFFKLVCQDLQLNEEKAEEMVLKWQEIRERTLEINKDVCQTIEKLKQKGYLIGTLTNITRLNHEVRAKKGIYNLFKINILSFKTGFKKPEPEIYKFLQENLHQHNIFPEETLFIDEKLEYLIPAANLGINVLLFENNKKLLEELKRLNINLN